MVVHAADRLRNLRRLKLGWITKLTHYLDHRALAALGSDAGRRKQVDALFLIKGSDNHLELGIRE